MSLLRTFSSEGVTGDILSNIISLLLYYVLTETKLVPLKHLYLL